MALDGYRFVQGFASSMVDSIDKRETAEREKKKMELLEQLRRDTAKWQMDYENAIAKRKVDPSLTKEDYDRGVRVLRNAEGTVLSEVPLSSSEIGDYKLTRRGLEAKTQEAEVGARYAEAVAKSGLARDAASIRASDASAANSAASRQLTARQLRGLDSKTGENSIDDRANELAFRQKNIVEDLIKSGIPAELVQKLAVDSVIQAAARRGSGITPEQVFIGAAGRLRQQSKNAAWREDRSSGD